MLMARVYGYDSNIKILNSARLGRLIYKMDRKPGFPAAGDKRGSMYVDYHVLSDAILDPTHPG